MRSGEVKILLWDIDGTLINNDRAGMYAWCQALAEEKGQDVAPDGLSPAGLTDVRIARLAVERVLQRPWDEALGARLLGRYVELLPEWLRKRSAGRVLPNVAEILAAAAGRDDVELALLTGNVAAGARLKLTHYGLWEHFAWGSFADATPERRQIARNALTIARRRHAVRGIEVLYVIGDTEHDIDCGKTIGARTIGVGTGPVSAAELARHEPWWAVDRLPEPEEFFARVAA